MTYGPQENRINDLEAYSIKLALGDNGSRVLSSGSFSMWENLEDELKDYARLTWGDLDSKYKMAINKAGLPDQMDKLDTALYGQALTEFRIMLAELWVQTFKENGQLPESIRSVEDFRIARLPENLTEPTVFMAICGRLNMNRTLREHYIKEISTMIALIDSKESKDTGVMI